MKEISLANVGGTVIPSLNRMTTITGSHARPSDFARRNTGFSLLFPNTTIGLTEMRTKVNQMISFGCFV
ncbi:MAG: hypothetical protein LBV32_03750 [Tannerellaceae bacterium]|jgi:hypothetical protein|nr:hypothetical protein [Tannerellaceae bacterium]